LAAPTGAFVTESDDIPNWFWPLIEETRPSLALLTERLETLNQTELEHWQRAYEVAAEAICPYWDGPDMGGDVGVLSEDDTEDFCNWIVSQGRALWELATAPGADLNVLVQLYWNAEMGTATKYPSWSNAEMGTATKYPSWSSAVANPAYRGYQDPSCIAYPIYRTRFDAELT
jgi:hypothetical protein